MTGPEFMAVGFTCVGDQFQVVATLCMCQVGQIAGQAPTKLQRSSNLNYCTIPTTSSVTRNIRQ